MRVRWVAGCGQSLHSLVPAVSACPQAQRAPPTRTPAHPPARRPRRPARRLARTSTRTPIPHATRPPAYARPQTWRLRQLLIRFYLRDAKVEADDVQDALTRNDGLMHGKFLKRSALVGLDRTSYVRLLRVGGELVLQGRHVRLYACDASTRAHFAGKGAPQAADEQPPQDAHTAAALKAAKPADAWYGTRTSSITRFLEASMGSQRDFSGDAASRAGKLDGGKLLYELEWPDANDGDERKPIRFWCAH